MAEQKGDRKIEKEEHQDERIEQTGQVTLDESGKLGNIHLISIIGEIEGWGTPITIPLIRTGWITMVPVGTI